MTAAEKAKELVKKFEISEMECENKHLAMLCVDEIEKELSHAFHYGDRRRVYYREVKLKIQNL